MEQANEITVNVRYNCSKQHKVKIKILARYNNIGYWIKTLHYIFNLYMNFL